MEKTPLNMESVPKKRRQVAVPLVTTSANSSGVQMVDCEHATKSAQLDLVEMARQIQMADEFTKSIASSKLTVIAEQVRFLQDQAKRVLEEARINAELHHNACNFHKVPGNIYYLYQRANGQKYFSMLAPCEWGSSCPHEFLNSYKLEYDMSWTPSENIKEKTRELYAIGKILEANNSTQGATKSITSGVNISMKYDVCDDSLPPTEMEY